MLDEAEAEAYRFAIAHETAGYAAQAIYKDTMCPRRHDPFLCRCAPAHERSIAADALAEEIVKGPAFRAAVAAACGRPETCTRPHFSSDVARRGVRGLIGRACLRLAMGFLGSAL